MSIKDFHAVRVEEMNNSELFNMYHQMSETLYIIRREIMARDIDWRHLAENGLTVAAIEVLREKNPTLTLKEAKDCVDYFRAF